MARILSDGCRDYLVEVQSGEESSLLQHRRGGTLRFRSLAEIRELLRRCGVERAVLRQRVADDEACAGAPAFHDLPFAKSY